MSPDQVYKYLRIAIPLRPELRTSKWKPGYKIDEDIVKLIGPYKGACYIATQVFCHMVPEADPWCNNDRSHFWAQIGDVIYDPTWDQFSYDFPYRNFSHKTKFKTFSERSQQLYAEVRRQILTNL